MILRFRVPERSLRFTKGFLRASEYVLLFAGFACLSCYGVVFLQASLFQSYWDWSLEQRLKGAPIPFSNEPLAPANQYVPPQEPGPLVVDPIRVDSRSAGGDPTLVGRIEIPALKLSAVVLEGVSSQTLRLAVGHIPGTSMPGEPGNVGLAGHRDTFFRSLSKIRRDDEIVLTTERNTYRYRVQSVEVVQPNETRVLQPSGQAKLTLVTCYPFYFVGPAPERFIVHAYQD